MKRATLSAMTAASLLGMVVFYTGAYAQVSINIEIGVPPPVPVYEVVPAPRPGYVWAPGYWDYRGHNHVWVKGRWVRERPGYVYFAPQWRHDRGRWHLQREYWGPAERHVNRGGDRDRDGIPNSYDRDRDGDGVRNSRDAYPDNPRRN